MKRGVDFERGLESRGIGGLCSHCGEYHGSPMCSKCANKWGANPNLQEIIKENMKERHRRNLIATVDSKALMIRDETGSTSQLCALKLLFSDNQSISIERIVQILKKGHRPKFLASEVFPLMRFLQENFGGEREFLGFNSASQCILAQHVIDRYNFRPMLDSIGNSAAANTYVIDGVAECYYVLQNPIIEVEDNFCLSQPLHLAHYEEDHSKLFYPKRANPDNHRYAVTFMLLQCKKFGIPLDIKKILIGEIRISWWICDRFNEIMNQF